LHGLLRAHVTRAPITSLSRGCHRYFRYFEAFTMTTARLRDRADGYRSQDRGIVSERFDHEVVLLVWPSSARAGSS